MDAAAIAHLELHDYLYKGTVYRGNSQYVITTEEQSSATITNPFRLLTTETGELIAIPAASPKTDADSTEEKRKSNSTGVVLPKHKPTPTHNPKTTHQKSFTLSEYSSAGADTVTVNTEDKIAVYFNFNSHLISSDGYESLRPLIQKYQSQQKPKITVVGYTDPINKKGEKYNNALALRRAEEVAKHLRYFGFEVQTEGKGLCCYLETDRLSRRAEVTISEEVIVK
jgi:outer membrane protein OmpA-like peptidoglycan-associated protein